MNLHEYQTKRLLSEYGVAVPEHRVADSADAVRTAVSELGGGRWIIKAQVHAGGRGKAGGVKLVSSPEEAVEVAISMLGSSLVTGQTGGRGQPISHVLVEAPSEIARELYAGIIVDRSRQRHVVMASTEGGVEIEKVAHDAPDKILQAVVHPLVGLQPYQCRELGFALGLRPEQLPQFTRILSGMARLFADKDLSLLEVNPLAVTKDGGLVCLDAKANADDNALFRHPALAALRDTSQEDERETRAREWDLNYIALDGNIGCMVNGAGLAMATMDLIKLHGGNPANFLDVGGSTTRERVAEAFKIILADAGVRGVLVNIFGGIVRCDMIAEGIVGAVAEVGIRVPVVVRLAGNHADRGREILDRSGMRITAASGLAEAARKIVAAVAGAA
ncbi:MAG: ADP-forming succinate--CoA ligase subunit beta [Gammaproteobacteria bacterium]|nr:ADP-forming succinate--CoA ligase subunit beta [Gammaproteobacteria bacterium]